MLFSLRSQSLSTALLLAPFFIFIESSCSSFAEIERAAAKLPTMRDYYKANELLLARGCCQFKEAHKFKESRLIDYDRFQQAVDLFAQTMKLCLNKPTQWLGQTNRLYQLLEPSSENFRIYAHKLLLKKGNKIIFKGDLHGDVHSLIAFIRYLQKTGYTSAENEYLITDPDFYLIFLGDYVDRGLWGVEVIYLLMMLKNSNPEHVFLVRGNHEDPQVALTYGYKYEFLEKFRGSSEKQLHETYAKIAQFYDYLPVVLYVGSPTPDGIDFIQCCHGGLEMGYNPKVLLSTEAAVYEMINKINRRTECNQKEFDSCMITNERNSVRLLRTACRDFVPYSPTNPELLGFMWHDFIVPATDPSLEVFGRGLMLNKSATDATLAVASTPQIRLSAIIRAHQHHASNDDPMMKLLLASKGCAVLWQEEKQLCLTPGTVITLLLSPDSMAGIPELGGGTFTGFDYDTCLNVTVGATLAEWKLTVINNEIFKRTVIEAKKEAGDKPSSLESQEKFK